MNAMLDRLETSSQTSTAVRVRRVARAAQPARVDPHQPRGRAPQPRPRRLAGGRQPRARRGRAHGGHGERAARAGPPRRSRRARSRSTRCPRSTSTSSVLDDTVQERRVPVDTDPGLRRPRARPPRPAARASCATSLDNAARHANAQVAVELRPPTTGCVELTVDDDGPGIPVEDRERVFDRFTRLDDGRARDAGGLGLGLSMVKAITEQHGGTVAIEDAPLGGARLRVRLPARLNPYRPGPCPSSRSPASTAHAGLQAAPQRRVRALRPRRGAARASTPT